MTWWTPEKTAEAKRLWLAGNSATIVAKEIGHPSRNAVIGKAFRLGWTRSEEVNEQNRTTARIAGMMAAIGRAYAPKPKKPKVSVAKPRKPTRNRNPFNLPTVTLLSYERIDEPVEGFDLSPLNRQNTPKRRRWAEDIHTVGVEIADLQSHHCRWPLGDFDAISTHFCGAHKADGDDRYCAGHAFQAHDKQSEPKRRFVVGRAA